MATRFKDTIQIGTSALVGLLAGSVFFAQGNVEITNRIIYPTAGSGIILQAGSTDVRWRTATFTNTGGLLKYDSFLASNPFNGTGVLLRAALLIDNNHNTSTWDCSFTSSEQEGTGGTVLMNNAGSGTGGSAFYPGSGDANGIVWNTGDFLKCGTSSSTTFSGSLIYQAIEFPGR